MSSWKQTVEAVVVKVHTVISDYKWPRTHQSFLNWNILVMRKAGVFLRNMGPYPAESGLLDSV